MADEIGYACVIARKFTNDATVSFQCNFPVGAPAEEINAELDRLAAIMERQQDRIDVPTLERQIAQQEENLKKQARAIAELQAQIDGGPDPLKRNNNVDQMRQQKNNALTTYKDHEDNLNRAKAHLEELRKKAA